MDSSSIELPGSEVSGIRLDGDVLTIEFSRAYIVKTMTGSKERTRWWQVGRLIFQGAEVEGDIPQGSLVCAGGDVGENVYTYRDMIPIPLESRGRASCKLAFKDLEERLVATAEGVTLEMDDRPYYLEHLRD